MTTYIMDTSIADEKVKTDIARLRRLTPAGVRVANFRIGQIVKSEARNNAPISPKQSQIAQRNKSGKTKQKVTPGGLQRSIRVMEVNEKYVDIGVPSNSEAGSYARKIHDFKGVDWHNRGVGTVAKGPQADEKFISRAIQTKLSAIRKVFESEIRRVLDKL